MARGQRKIMIMLFVTMIMGISISALAQQANDFKGARIGDDREKIKTIFNSWTTGCRDANATDPFDFYCWGSTTFGGAKAFVMLFFIGDHLTSITIDFEQTEFDAVVAAMKQKYGNSPEKSSQVVQTNAGVKHQNDIYRWKNGQTVITAERFSSKITESIVTFRSEADLEKRLRRSKESEKKRVKDM
jgi:hypothetical protein